ncbi:hypothetical protein C482_14259 [Natrialba chahannaoensis JCM 10990]|uniref:Methyltransferase type 11 domain-containing protein n=1 Tax=Natrialba chahannaoensis JCM 10990 TaxID=1227492 RepID=M0AEW0_9EURY|nr:class I SAM-dependent methyltransferase [Natrialba chahannaoensis]ELY96941.1 hypothetical protein C482_14259 [Natrialba chahannaoensis JCM 10990]
MSDLTDTLEETQAFYDEYGTNEWDRLATGMDGELEFGETVDTLASNLPSSGQVLDAGGGAGRYSQWLAARGHDVTLLDLSRGQLSVAADRIDDADTDGDSDSDVDADAAGTVSLVQGSITDLGLPANVFDAVCCLGGPLSHLLDEADRAQAVRELRRVAKPDAPVVVSVMGLLGAVQLYLLSGHNVAALPDSSNTATTIRRSSSATATRTSSLRRISSDAPNSSHMLAVGRACESRCRRQRHSQD